MGIHNVSINSLQGSAFDLSALSGQVVLLVNVASKCGLTPQYTGLEKLHETYASRGFSVVGAPCNQFMGQEPGTPTEIEQFCSTTYGVTFPLLEKIDVNGESRHPLYQQVVETPDASGHTGDIRWNFEKFLIGPNGEVAARFGPQVEPDAPEVITAIEALLPPR
jgi:glutathione peroxidase